MAETLIEVKNLSKSFPVAKDLWGRTTKSLQAVSHISLDIKAGECLTLVGESGCGKSTLARLILKLIEADGGSVVYKGQDLLTLSGENLRKLRPELQMVFQNPFSSLDPRYKVRDSIAEPLRIHKGSFASLRMTKQCTQDDAIKERVLELIKLVELDETILDKYPHECSGGQNQRVCIARALALNPRLVVADEAVSALDVSTQWRILRLMKRLQNELGVSFLFIAHNLGVVKYVADRVAVMYLGEIVELATKDELFSNPLHPYTKALLNAAPIADPRQRDRKRIYLGGEIPKATDIPSGCPFHTRCPVAISDCSRVKPTFTKHGETQVSCLLVK
jgi:oligopeptide/dipeptide ABC transporter ATP-binding protein